MTAKDEWGISKVKQKYLNDEIITVDPQKYKNLNLSGKPECCRNAKATFFESNSFEKKKHRSKENGERYSPGNDYKSFKQSKQNSSFSNKFDKSLNQFEYLDLHNSPQKDLLNSWKKKKKNDTSKVSSSTLSLHITAYENSILAQDSSFIENGSSKCARRKDQREDIQTTFSSFIHNPFEFPRQQNDETCDPEIMQFKASQKLLNPNSSEAPTESQMATTSSSHDLELPPIISDDDEENISLPKKVRKKLLIDSSEDEAVMGIEEDLEKSEEEDISGEDEDDDDEVSIEGEEDSDEAEDDDEEGDSDESDSSEASETSLLSFDSEFSWDEFQYIGDNADSSFIQDEEESLRERYNTVMKMLLSEQSEEGFDSLSILYEEALIQKQLTSDFTSFDWEKAKSQFIKNCEPKMRMLAFGITRALARFAKDPTLFYLQALSLRPTDKALWYEFGCASARLHNLKTAELAFKQCLSPHSDAGIKLAVVYFYSKDYHKCLPLLREMLTTRSNNLVLWILKSEISKINSFWKYFVELYFPSNSLFFQEPTIPSEVYAKVLQEIRSFDSAEPPEEKFLADYSIEPLLSEPIRINVDQPMESFAQFLCKYFDQSLMQQLPFLQNVHFAKEKRHHSTRLNASSLSGSFKERTPVADSNSLLALPDGDETEATCSSVISDMINVVEDVQSVVEKLVDDVVHGKVPKPVRTKRRPPRSKNPNLSLDVRRSGRTSKEIPFEAMDSPVIGSFQPQVPSNTDPVTIRTLLDLPSDDTTIEPLEFPGARGYPFEEISYSIIPPFTLETFNVYLTTLLNKQHLPMEKMLQTFLQFFSWNLPAGCCLTFEQRKLFLEVYIRWTETFCQPLHQHCLHASIKDASIHLLALELDVEEKLKAGEACDLIFARYSGIFQQQSESTVKLNVTSKGQEEIISEKGMRKKAIELLKEVDPEMAAKIKSCMEESRASSKALSKDTNIEDAIGALTFSRDDYYSGGLKPIRPKAKKSNVPIVEVKELPSIKLVADKNDETYCFNPNSFNLCEPSSSTSPSTSTVTETNAKFIKLWADLSKIMQRIVKNTPKEAAEDNTEKEMSPMNETDMMSLLNDFPNLSDDEDADGSNVFQSFKDIQTAADKNENVGKMIKEYMVLLESFVKEFKYKKEVDANSIKSFMDETKTAIEAMKSILNQDLIPEEEDIQMDDDENEKLREIAVRFYWFKIKKCCNDRNVELKKAYLTTILHLLDLDKPVYSQLRDGNGKYTVITAKNIVKMLMSEFRNEKVKAISSLIAQKKHQEVILQFTTDFNWYSCDEKEIISNIQILLSSFEAIKDRKGPVEWICRLLDPVLSGKFEHGRDEIYSKCLEQLEHLNLEEIDHDVLKQLARRLVIFSEYDRFKKNIQLWKLMYRIASILEGSYDENSRLEMYQAIEAYKFLMPTKALCVLVEGHRILGEDHHCCTKNNGELLYFFIDELYKNYYDFRFEDHYYSKLVQRNIELQLIQCLKCLFDSSIGKAVVYDHECSKSLTPTIADAKKVQPFLIPSLPMFDDEKFTTNDVIEALTRVFPFIEHEKVLGFDEAWSSFEAFIKDPPFFKFEIKKNELQAVGDFEKANLWPSVELTEENREKLELFVYLRYVLLVIKYKKQQYSWEENEKLAQLAKECLVLSGPPERGLLPVKVIHSLWAICAYTHTMYFCYLDDEELAKQSNSYFYMFKMAFLQYPEAFQLHIDIAIAYYQINSRIRRHKRSLSNNKLPEDIEATITREDMIEQCQLHFNQFRYRISQTNEYPKDISWIEPYFSGKIAEQSERFPSEVFDHYYRCAMLMRSEAYTYPLRVNKTTQENVEPLELHYRVHVYAMKQIFALEKIKSYEKRIERLKIIQYYLRLFLGHFIFAKKNPPPLPPIETSLPFVSSTPPWDFEEPPEFADEGQEYFDDAIQDIVELMVTYTDLKIECLEYCRRAFETIVKRFPHYKSYYQLALLHLIKNEFQQGLDIIFGKLFKGKFVSFEKVTDIERTDIERSDTLAYHIKKLVRLSLALLKKCRDIHKTNSILEDLVKESASGRMKLKPNERTNFLLICMEIYQEAAIKVIRSKSMDQINSLIKYLEKASSVLRINKKPEFDEKVKGLINRCRNAIRSMIEAREKQRNSEMAATQLKAMIEVQRIIAEKQKQDMTERVKQVAEEEARKQRAEEEEKKRRAAEFAAEKKKRETTEAQKNLLLYQQLQEAKKAEKVKKAEEAKRVEEAKEAEQAKKAEILKLITEKLNRIVNNPLLLPLVKKQMDERKPALLFALKGSVEKGESLITLMDQLDKFDNTLQKSSAPTATQSTQSNTPRLVSQQQNGSSTSKQLPMQQPLNLSTTSSSTISTSKSQMPTLIAQKALNGPLTTSRRPGVSQHSNTPQKEATPQPRNAKTALQTPSIQTPQKSPRSTSSSSSATPSKASTPSKSLPVDDTNSRQLVINEIEKLMKEYAQDNLKNFYQHQRSMLQRPTQELQQIYSKLFVQYVCGKTATPGSTTSSTNSNSGKRTAAQISPSTGSNVASKVRRTDNSGTAATKSSASSANTIPTTQQRTSQPQPRNNQTNIVPQRSQHLSSSAATVSKTTRFDHLTEQVKKAIPQTLPSSSSTAANKSASDDDIMIIGETKGGSSSFSSKSSLKNLPSSSVSSSSTPKKELSESEKRIVDLMFNVAAQSKTPQTTSSSPRQPQTSTSSRPQQTSSSPAATPRTPSLQQQSLTQRQNVTTSHSNNITLSASTTATSASSNVAPIIPNLSPAAMAQFANMSALVQQQMRHLLQNSTPQYQQQILQAFLQPSSQNNQPPSTNPKR